MQPGRQLIQGRILSYGAACANQTRILISHQRRALLALALLTYKSEAPNIDDNHNHLGTTTAKPPIDSSGYMPDQYKATELLSIVKD